MLTAVIVRYAMSESPVSLVALVLSVCAVTLLIINGITTHSDYDNEQKTLSAAHVWHYDHDTKIASTHSDVKAVCVGYDDCTETNSADHILRVNGGIQLGNGPVFRTTQEGRQLVVEDSKGNQILRADLSTGGTVVGDGLIPPASGMQVDGFAKDSIPADSTQMWLSTKGFRLFEDADTPASSVHSVVHKEDSGIYGVRISPPGPVVADRAVHLTPQGIVVGDAPASFIRQNAGKAGVLVYGQALQLPTLDPHAPTCHIPSFELPGLQHSSTGEGRVVKATMTHCNPARLTNLERLPLVKATCDHKYVFFLQSSQEPAILGSCQDSVVFYCLS